MASSQAPTSDQAPSSSNQIPTDFKVYRPPNVANAAPLPALSDDYFTPTTADLKQAQATLSARTNALVNAPLQLKAIREAAEKSKRDRWPEVSGCLQCHTTFTHHGIPSLVRMDVNGDIPDQDSCQIPRSDAVGENVSLDG